MNKSRKEELETILNEKIRSIGWDGKVDTLSGCSYFLKEGAPSDAYACEAHGLSELSRTQIIQVARVAGYGKDFILTEYIPTKNPSGDFYKQLGRGLATLHQVEGEAYGFYEDNFIGANPQPNIPDSTEEAHDWATFYYQKRLFYQYQLADTNGYTTRILQKGMAALETQIVDLLAGSEEKPVLLHGDLWRGNYLCDASNQPVLIDPAVYYGHREADLGMTYLFGGFPQSFYTAYQEVNPLPYGWEERVDLYKLYHLLNHLNLFGRAYLKETEWIIQRYTGV